MLATAFWSRVAHQLNQRHIGHLVVASLHDITNGHAVRCQLFRLELLVSLASRTGGVGTVACLALARVSAAQLERIEIARARAREQHMLYHMHRWVSMPTPS